MSEGSASSGQRPEQQTPQQKPDPCDDPKPPEEPTTPPDQKEPPPDREEPCGEGKDPCADKPGVDPWEPRCPDPPPDPCAEPKPDPGVAECAVPDAADPAGQLAGLKAQLSDEQNAIEELEQKKTSIADLTERIQSLQKVVDSLRTSGDAYREFYQTTQVQRQEAECFIPTVRCQLELDDPTKACIGEAITAVDQRVQQTVDAYTQQRDRVKAQEERYAQAEWRLKDAKLIHEFFKAGLQDSVKKRRDDLGKLKQLADPKKNKCEVEFYLREMVALIASGRKPPEASGPCYPPKDPTFWSGLTLGTYIDCWPPANYEKAWGQAVVRLNNAEYVEKCRKAALEAARKRLTELEKAAKEAREKRREWILKELKDRKCCGGNGPCP